MATVKTYILSVKNLIEETGTMISTARTDTGVTGNEIGEGGMNVVIPIAIDPALVLHNYLRALGRPAPDKLLMNLKKQTSIRRRTALMKI
ncbi:hypothetical protein CRM22_007878 [Opisthorchis felineus]|uniref:Uncharacterized protein n=1 Tax=Opisthorchis felineus TaxID=147828 RepID=A0A4S2LEH3_OPIFE|nr:hypothetical protein CRM22_007878 [Opisthorchis felineus]